MDLGRGDRRGLADDELHRLADRWLVFLVIGVAAIVIGLLLVTDIFTAVRTLALLVGFSLLLTGIDDLSSPERFHPRWMGLLSGVAYLVAGFLAIVWPGVTLWALAVVTGVGLLVAGVVHTAGVIREHDYTGWWLVLLAGLISIAAGLMALAWPEATILVLAVLLGVRTLVFGITEVVFAMWLRGLRTGGGAAAEPGAGTSLAPG